MDQSFVGANVLIGICILLIFIHRSQLIATNWLLWDVNCTEFGILDKMKLTDPDLIYLNHHVFKYLQHNYNSITFHRVISSCKLHIYICTCNVCTYLLMYIHLHFALHIYM
jgi:hypothetical protein